MSENTKASFNTKTEPSPLPPQEAGNKGKHSPLPPQKGEQITNSMLRHSFAKNVPFEKYKLKSLIQGISEIFKSSLSSDLPTRKASFIFILSFLGIFFVLACGVTYYWGRPQYLSKIEKEKPNLEYLEKMDAETKKEKSQNIFFKLGEFTLDLKEKTKERLAPSVMNMVEMELVIQCDTKETHQYLETHPVQIKNEITKILISLDRDQLLSKEGKKKIKTEILERLNQSLPQGKIEDIFFTRLILN